MPKIRNAMFATILLVGLACEKEEAAEEPATVILYATDWCKVCKSAESYFQREGIAYERRDIDEDTHARVEMLRKTKAAGVSSASVPVFDVDGEVISGFDKARINRLLGR